ncbi:MAG TPA: TIGR03032 family protein [Thermoanaerobaculia bacterium]|nr:TIGR03032 family protein [Thermoanaerobaculia bacterium]
MRLDTEFVKLPLLFDADRLAAEIAAIPETDWRPHPQGHPGNSALPLIAAEGDPGNDATRGPMRPTPHLARCPYLRQVLASFGAVLGRTRLMRLDGNAEATPHSDTNYYWMQRVRIHVPVVTRPEVQFLCGDRSVHMAAGEAWIFDTWKTHNVLNPNPTRRIHLVSDTVGSAAFWDLVALGKTRADPRFVPFDADRDPALEFETVNQPVVMSPWEQEVLLASFSEDLGAGDGLAAELRAELDRFRRDWRALWASHGEAASGWSAYRSLLENLQARLARFEGRLRLANGSEAVEIVRQMVVRPGLNPDLKPSPSGEGLGEVAGAIRPGNAQPDAAAYPPRPHPPAPSPKGEGEKEGMNRTAPFDRPVFIVSSPRSGTSLLFETLAQAPGLWTTGGESHEIIEGIEALHPARRSWESNRLTAEDADPATVQALTRRFLAQLRDRDGNSPSAGARGLRFLEKTPKNSLRVPFLAAAFPDALFIYLYRDPRETISSQLDAWKSGRFVTYPGLPEWEGPPWSLLLVPGWRDLKGKDLAGIVARQWATATSQLLDDLEALPPGRWCVASYDRLVSEPQTEIERLCGFIDVAWDRTLTAPLPLSRHTLTSPEPDKWRHNGEELKPVMPQITNIAQRARDVFAHPPAIRPARRPPPATDPNAFRSVYTNGFPRLLAQLGASLLVSTYQSGRLIAVRADGTSLNTHFRSFPSPMGIAVGPHVLALGTQRHVWEYRNQPEVGAKLQPRGKHDACFLPRKSHVTGDIRVHELAFAEGGLWIVNTRFSCLAALDGEHSFAPRWRPPFVTALSADDRCHLNGLAVVDGKVRFVTALGATDAPQGWRENKASGGILMDVLSNEIVARGLSMPHSPRWHAGRLWVLESGKGEIGTVDLSTGRVNPVAQLPGFTRGLAFAGPYAFVGLSQVRESNVFGGLPLTERVKEKLCGVWVVDVRTGETAAFLRFEGLVQEIFDVQLLPGICYPEIAEPDSDLIAGAFALPAEALREVAGVGG